MTQREHYYTTEYITAPVRRGEDGSERGETIVIIPQYSLLSQEAFDKIVAIIGEDCKTYDKGPMEIKSQPICLTKE